MRALIALCLFALLTGSAGAATLELVEVEPYDGWWGEWSLAGDTHMVMKNELDRYAAEATWTPPPAVFDDKGFWLTMNITVTGKSDPLDGGIFANPNGLVFEPPDPNIYGYRVEPGQSESRSSTALVRPPVGLKVGQRVYLNIGVQGGPSVTYHYVVTTAGGGAGLRVTHDCPPEIVISALPSVNCHLIISGWRRNTADPIRVTLPFALDTFGNHANGLQAVGAGEEDVFEWDEPYLWGFFFFACPAQPGTGANCYDSITQPGRVGAPIVVQQGDDLPIRIDVNFTAVPHP